MTDFEIALVKIISSNGGRMNQIKACESLEKEFKTLNRIESGKVLNKLINIKCLGCDYKDVWLIEEVVYD